MKHPGIEQWTLLQQVGLQIACLRDLDELARRITRLIQSSLDYYYVAIFTLEPGDEFLRFRACALRAGAADYPVSPRPVCMGDGTLGIAAASGQEILVNPVIQDEVSPSQTILSATRAELALPFIIQERVLGVLDVQSDQADEFQEADRLILQALASSIAIAVEGTHLYNALQRRADQLAAVAEVSTAIASILDRDELLQEVVTRIQDHFGYPYIYIFDVHPGRRKVFYQAGNDARTLTWREAGIAYDLDDPGGIVPWVARNGETVWVADIEADERYVPAEFPPDPTRSELAVPLVFGGEVLGVLDVRSNLPAAFGEEDRFLLEALGGSIAVALRNAYLYRSERWRRQVADSMREVAGMLSAEVDLDRVLAAILVELERSLPCDVSAIWLLDGDLVASDSPDASLPSLWLAAMRIAGQAPASLQTGLTLHEIIGDYPQLFQVSELPDEPVRSWLREALTVTHPVVRGDETAFEPLGVILGFPPNYSAIAMPLRVGEAWVGVLTLVHHTANRYGTEACSMIAAFASYAAAAIENTRLYDAAHEQAWVSTVLLQVADATRALTNLNELLATVVRITPMLVGVKACALYLLDESEAFVPAAVSGLAPEAQADFERWRFGAGDTPAFDRLRQERQPIILQDVSGDRYLTDIFLAGSRDASCCVELVVLVPLLARGELLGAMLVDYQHHQGTERLTVFFDEHLSIIQGIAHQTAIAVENLRLSKAQKEEAYVSVALLQVAQAIVSSKDLDETLGAIVRITPMLVGVKRVAIFLWETARHTFSLSQVYGLPRSLEGLGIAQGEFPLLDAVRREPTMLAIEWHESRFPGENALDGWRAAELPTQSMEYLLSEAPCLVLGLPLVVQGDLLGVLVVEEPSPVPVDPGGSANRRLREKRLEITTGISQQVALAIQNTHLQSERMERERLEREMQLAREIQSTFLPTRMPDLPGWDLNVWWRTARQVSGDFYDFFELPDDRLGIVVADVADKGMPAALFMTMCRTLIRATVSQVESPAEVLRRVNDALAPDAQGGMFVTLIYAVLSLEDGMLIYANAGHNPPMLFRHATHRIKHLDRTAMALGIMERIPIGERRLYMEPGDCLVLYTDGITEAFAETDEMFGENRLRFAIMQAEENPNGGLVSAQEMIESIDNALSDFIGSAPLADDITLMVLARTGEE